VRSGSAVDDHGRAIEIFRADERTATKRRRAFFAMTGLIAIAIVGSGIAIHATRPPPPPPPVAPTPAPAPEPLPGAVTFEIKPEGEIYVDGVFKGKSPPLKKFQVPAGSHTFEVRNSTFKTFKPLVVELTVGPGEEFAVEHNFVMRTPPKPPVKAPAKAPPKPKPQAKQGPPSERGFWDRFVDWFKG
jgi:hypothetical protein